MSANNVPNVPHIPVEPDVPGSPNPADPNAPPTGPEPSVDTTQRQAPGPSTKGPLKLDAQAPKMPHERDESVDMTHGESDPKMEQAYRDVQRGLQDTDRGPSADKAYQKQKS